jgi:hypothetical protein
MMSATPLPAPSLLAFGISQGCRRDTVPIETDCKRLNRSIYNDLGSDVRLSGIHVDKRRGSSRASSTRSATEDSI